MNKGYTLIELVIVVALLGIIGIIGSNIFILNLRTQKRNEIQKNIKQSGDYIMRVIQDRIKESVSLNTAGEACNHNSISIGIKNPDGNSTIFECPVGGSNQLSQSEGDGDYNKTPETTSILTPQDMSISGCIFRIVCPNPPTSPKYVFISFILKSKVYSQDAYSRGELTYQATVTTREY